jgi:Domain of unknown function DUF29
MYIIEKKEVIMKTAKKVVRASPKRPYVCTPVSKKKEFKYDKDFFKWTQEQAKLLQKGDFEKLDIDHLREEIESLGISLQRALESYIANLLMHKLKIKYQPGMHTNSWDNSIKNAIFQIKKLITKNPSLKTYLPEIFKDAYYTARLDASSETKLEEKIFPEECPWTIEELFPDLNKKYIK